MQKTTPFLMFNDQAQEAMNFNVSFFKDARIVSIMLGEKIDPQKAELTSTIAFSMVL